MSPWTPCVTFGLSHRQWEQAIHSAGPLPTTLLPSWADLSAQHPRGSHGSERPGQLLSVTQLWETGLIWKPARRHGAQGH